MATLTYNRVTGYFSLYHCDDYKIYFKHRDDYEMYKKYEIPSYEDIVNNNLNILSKNEYFENYILNNIGEDFKWLYNIYCVTESMESELNKISYTPIVLNTYSQECINKDIKNVKGIKKQNLYKFFGLKESFFNEMINFMNEKNIDVIVVKRNIKLFLYKNNNEFPYLYSLIKGEPIKKEYSVEWKKRYLLSYLKPNIPKYYKKEIISEYIGGTLGEYLITLDFKDLYPNLYYIEPKVFENEIPEVIDIDEPCTYNEEQLKYKKEQERLEEERIKKYKEDLEIRKKTPGYCSRCGSPNASYIENPYQKEINGLSVYEWMCSDCYNDCLGDI